MIALLIVACWWPSLAPSPSQPLIVEVSLGDTAGSDTPTEAGNPRPEAPSPLGSAGSEPGPGESAPEADPGVGGDHAN
jgi:hypothetical protein